MTRYNCGWTDPDEELPLITVYKVTSPSSKVYIGITSKSLARRKCQHLSAMAAGSDYNFHRAIRKYGDSLVWEILAQVSSLQETSDLERSYITQFNSFVKWYNMTLGGEGQLGHSFPHSEESKLKISENNSKFWTGKARSDETRKKISDAQKGIPRGPLSEIAKRKLSEQKQGQLNPMFGKHPVNYKGPKPQCLDCPTVLVVRKATRCMSCAAKYRHLLRREAA